MENEIYKHFLNQPKSDWEPIYDTCSNATCFCTGKCKQVIGQKNIKTGEVNMFPKQLDTRVIYEQVKQFIEEDNRTPIKRGCIAAEHGGCCCTGACQEVIGYK